MTRNFLIALLGAVLLAGLMLTGCQTDEAEASVPPATATEPASSSDGPEITTVAAVSGGEILDVIGNEITEDGGYLCPVSGNTIANTDEELAKHPYLNYKDKTYHLWCPNCEAKFTADPEGYLAGEVPTCSELGTCDEEGHEGHEGHSDAESHDTDDPAHEADGGGHDEDCEGHPEESAA